MFQSFKSKPRRLEPREWSRGGAAGRRSLGAIALKHALQERGGLDQLPRTREARGLAKYILIQHRITLFCRRERP